MMAWDDTFDLDDLTGARLYVTREEGERSARLVAEGDALPRHYPRRPLHHGGAPRDAGPLIPHPPGVNRYGQTPTQEEWHTAWVTLLMMLPITCALAALATWAAWGVGWEPVSCIILGAVIYGGLLRFAWKWGRGLYLGGGNE